MTLDLAFRLPLLSVLIWLPIVGGVAVLALGEKRAVAARWLSLLVMLAGLLLSVFLYTAFDPAGEGMQLVEKLSWLPAMNAWYRLGVDGISVALILLTTFTGVLVVAGAWSAVTSRVHQYFAAFLFLQGLMIGVFCAQDALLFYMFFEGMLIPMFLIIGIWGGDRRVYATLKFFLYTFFGSVFMLVALIWLYLKTGSFDLAELGDAVLTRTEQSWLFFAFLLAFAVKVPMFPVHTWLPDAHVQAPTAGSVVLAAILLKIGGYGFLRFNLPITPDASQDFAWLVIALSLIAIVYIGFVALVQEDMKKLIAYSSISHMGFVTLGVFVAMALVRDYANPDAAQLAVQGAMVQMISHGFVSGALFTCVGILYERRHSRMIRDYGGVANVMPWFAAFWVLFAMANCGLPGTSGFVGEFMVILAVFQSNVWLAFGAAITLVLGAAYTLWLTKRVIFGAVVHADIANLRDVNAREMFVLAAFAVPTLLLGIWPKPLIDLMNPAVVDLVLRLAAGKA